MTALLDSVRAAAEAQFAWEQDPDSADGEAFVKAAVSVDFRTLLRLLEAVVAITADAVRKINELGVGREV